MLGEKSTAEPPKVTTEAEPHKLLHELQVLRIELELQNVELLQARAELETLLEKYTDIYDFAPVAYLTLNRQGVIRDVNHTGSELLGIERSRLRGRSFDYFVADGDRPAFSAFLAKVFSNPAKVSCELSLLKAGNSSFDTQIEAVAVPSAEECRVAVIDISERRRMEELQQYRSVVEDQTEIICRCNADRTLTFANNAYYRFFGKTRDELLGSTWHPVVFADDLPMVKEQLSTLSPSIPVVVIENRVYAGTGEVRWVQFVNRGFFDANGRLMEIQATARDITDRKEVENALRTSQERLGLALAASRMGVWDWNVQTNGLYWSPEVADIFGMENFNCKFESFFSALHPDDVEHIMAAAKQALAENTVYAMEYRIIRPDGQVRWLSDFARPVYDEKGNPLRLTGTVQDITERKRAENEIKMLNADLAARTAELENTNQELEAFNYMVSHDLRRPLNNIFTST